LAIQEATLDELIFLPTGLGLFLLLFPYFAQAPDRAVLDRKPQPPDPPNSEALIAFKELELAKTELDNLTGTARWAKERELAYLERRLDKIKARSELEFRGFFQARTDWVQAWEDFYLVFEESSYWSRSFNPRAKAELTVFRERYRSAKRAFRFEQERLWGRERVWLKEGEHATKAQTLLGNEPSSPEQQDFEVRQLAQEEGLKQPGGQTGEGIIPPAPEVTEALFFELSPNLKGVTYIDPSLNMEQAGFEWLEGVDLRGASLLGINFLGVSQFVGCDFSGADFSAATFGREARPHRFLACRFTKARLVGTSFEYTAFYNCTFDRADLQGVNLDGAKFIGGSFAGCPFAGLDFSKTVMSKELLETLDFQAAAFPPKNLGSLGETEEPKPETEAG